MKKILSHKKEKSTLERVADLPGEVINMIPKHMFAPRTVVIQQTWEEDTPTYAFHHMLPYDPAPSIGIENGTYEEVREPPPVPRPRAPFLQRTASRTASLLRRNRPPPEANLFHMNWKRDTLALNPGPDRIRDPRGHFGDRLDRNNSLFGLEGFNFLLYDEMYAPFTSVQSLVLGHLTWPVNDNDDANRRFRDAYRLQLYKLVQMVRLKKLTLVIAANPSSFIETERPGQGRGENALVTQGQNGVALCQLQIEAMLQALCQGPGAMPKIPVPELIILKHDDPRAPRFTDDV
ncbi:hypothetical protein HYFRA_00012862 [Hymenoscyphus fraxineus]|uniref:Uncharacterized protein n=1 Tax=Hymenoscyphus fraxineus TaxID=746836 RepID=A0A9N9L361_9HELO|nr:hypothetical protein HYFRA_00012862 [Hymenoscyphus fraxineus]